MFLTIPALKKWEYSVPILIDSLSLCTEVFVAGNLNFRTKYLWAERRTRQNREEIDIEMNQPLRVSRGLVVSRILPKTIISIGL